MLPLLTAAFLTVPAWSGALDGKTMRQEWPESHVERDLVLPKGWFEVDVGVDHKRSTAVRDLDGLAQPLQDGAAWSFSQAHIGLHHGLSRRTRVYLTVPWVRARLRTGSSDSVPASHITTLAMGDVHTGVIVQPWISAPPGRTEAPRTWAVAAQLDLKAPSGLEWTSAGTGAPDEIKSFLAGTGVTNLGAFAHGKIRMSPAFSTHLAVGWVFKFPAIVGYVVEVDGFGNGKLNPGDELRVDLDATVQLGNRLALTANGRLSRRGWTTMGVSGPGLRFAEWDYLEDPALFVDVGGAASIEASQALELRLHASAQVMGTTTALWAPLGLEELAPQPGLTTGLQAVMRW
jgi:hypothetical protein